MTALKWDDSKIGKLKQRLNEHPLLVGETLSTIDDVRIFMEHHVFAVWDFMCLAKSLQRHVAPANDIWFPTELQRSAGRLINEIILGEESDVSADGTDFSSHFDLYTIAMSEIGSDMRLVDEFLDRISTSRILSLNQILLDIPSASRKFVTTTFEFIATEKPHVIAAAFAFGRETIIPGMFTQLLKQQQDIDAPTFAYYLQRHIELDGDHHGNAAQHLVELTCEGNPEKIAEAYQAAVTAIEARYQFWTDVQAKIERVKQAKQE